MTTTDNVNDDCDPLPLLDLKLWVSEDIYEWLEDAERKDRSWKKIESTITMLQQQQQQQQQHDPFPVVDVTDTESLSSSAPSSVTEEGTQGDNSVISSVNSANLPSVGKKSRIQYWISSKSNPDGVGGIGSGIDEEDLKNLVIPSDALKVSYVLSESWQGFGNQVWASSRHLANLLAYPETCRKLLGLADNSFAGMSHGHPLKGKSFVELGAGTSIPSTIAMQLGARVVITDQVIADRIRCTAEIAERNYRTMISGKMDEEIPSRGHVVPYNWGTSAEEVLAALNGGYEYQDFDGSRSNGERFDVLVAADCCFMPWFHAELVESVDMLISDKGVAIFTFACHGNVDDEHVWDLFDQLEQRYFKVHKDLFPPTQLTPQFPNKMHQRQAAIYTVCLTREAIP